MLFQRPLPPVNSDRYMPARGPVNHKSCLRVRSVNALMGGRIDRKTEDILACLRSAVSDGAEKNKGS